MRRSIGAALDQGADRLRRAGIDSPRLDTRVLLAHALGLTPEELLRDRHALVETAAFDAMLARRVAREPLALILGHRDFWTLRLAVSPATLIPRPDSETLIEAAFAAFPDRAVVRRVLDLGTGTGALLLAALTEFPAAFGIGVDRAPDAAALASRNAGALWLHERAAFLCGCWAMPLAGLYDLVLCNPPYIVTGDLAGLMPDVALFEPASALDGGADGLDAYRAIVPDLPRLLSPGGVAILELGAGQEAAVSRLAAAAGMTATTRADLAGIARALVLRAR